MVSLFLYHTCLSSDCGLCYCANVSHHPSMTLSPLHTHSLSPCMPTQIENAGGHSSADGKQISALDVPITNCDQRTQICYGSFEEVKRFEVCSVCCSS